MCGANAPLPPRKKKKKEKKKKRRSILFREVTTSSWLQTKKSTAPKRDTWRESIKTGGRYRNAP